MTGQITGQITGHTTGHTTGHSSALDLLAPEHRGLFIGGAWREAEGGGRLDVVDPADGSVLTDVADASPADAVAALDAAVAAQADWARTPPRDRGEILRRAFEMITDRADDFARLMSLDARSVHWGIEELRFAREPHLAAAARGRIGQALDENPRSATAGAPLHAELAPPPRAKAG